MGFREASVEVMCLGTDLALGQMAMVAPQGPRGPQEQWASCPQWHVVTCGRIHCASVSAAGAWHRVHQQGDVHALHPEAAGLHPAHQVSLSRVPKKRLDCQESPRLHGARFPVLPVGDLAICHG